MTENVFLFVPNLIGYGRIVLALISFLYMRTDHVIAAWCYVLSGLLDAVDGHAARILGQSSKFGAMLDQLTDRCATMCLLACLCYFYPQFMFPLQISMAVDVASHWLHLHSCTMKGSASHKLIDLSGNPILRVYYTNRNFLFFMCGGNELFYSTLYLLHFTPGPTINLYVVSFGLFTFLCMLSCPVAIAKTLISLVHLVTAAQNVVIVDTEEREEQRREKDREEKKED